MISKVLKKITFAKRIAADKASFLKLIFAQIYLHPKINKGKKRNLSLKLKIRNAQDKTAVFHFRRADDLGTLKTVFFDDEYNLQISNQEVKTILDLGANAGLSVIYFKLKYPDAKIIAVEPAKNIREQLRKNIEQFSNIAFLDVAIADKDAPVSFYENSFHPVGSSLTNRRSDDKETKVRGLTLESIMKEASISSIDILKFDIEGAEFLVLNKENLKNVKIAVGEVHFDINREEKALSQIFQNFNYQIKRGKDKKRGIIYAKNDKTIS